MLSTPSRENGGVGLSLLRSAADDIVAEWSSRAQTLFHPSEEISEIVAEIVGAVEEYCGESQASPRVFAGEVGDRHLYHRLVQEMRARILAQWREGRPSFTESDVSEILLIVFCLEEMRRELWTERGDDLASRLSGPDAVELLVEVAHDMRSPLSSILFLAETLRGGRSGEVNDLQRRQLGLIYSAGLGLMSMTNDVVDAAKQGTGFVEEEPTAFSLDDLFDSIRELVRPVAEEKELELSFRGPRQDYVEGHQRALNRVLLNLVTNALKFTEEGGVTVTADRIDRVSMEFEVVDTGRGMEPDQIRALFQPFQKSEYRRGHFFSDSGLGLSIARRLLRAMDSELEVESEVGHGTRFSFSIALPSSSSV